MKTAPVVIVVVAAAAVGAWFARDTAPVRQTLNAVGLHGPDATVETGPALAAAGVHKCRGAGGITYLDHACPRGSVELAANGGAVTVMSFPKAPPPPASAASGLMQGFSREDTERMRERQIDAAMNR